MIEVESQLCPSLVNNDITFHWQVVKLEKGNMIGLLYKKFDMLAYTRVMLVHVQ